MAGTGIITQKVLRSYFRCKNLGAATPARLTRTDSLAAPGWGNSKPGRTGPPAQVSPLGDPQQSQPLWLLPVPPGWSAVPSCLPEPSGFRWCSEAFHRRRQLSRYLKQWLLARRHRPEPPVLFATARGVAGDRWPPRTPPVPARSWRVHLVAGQVLASSRFPRDQPASHHSEQRRPCTKQGQCNFRSTPKGKRAAQS